MISKAALIQERNTTFVDLTSVALVLDIDGILQIIQKLLGDAKTLFNFYNNGNRTVGCNKLLCVMELHYSICRFWANCIWWCTTYPFIKNTPFGSHGFLPVITIVRLIRYGRSLSLNNQERRWVDCSRDFKRYWESAKTFGFRNRYSSSAKS